MPTINERMGAAEEKKRRVYYQHIVYSVCNMLDQIEGRHHCIVCGTAEEPCNNVEAKIQQLTTELDSLRQQLAAAQERNTKLQSEHLDHVSALHKRIAELEAALAAEREAYAKLKTITKILSSRVAAAKMRAEAAHA